MNTTNKFTFLAKITILPGFEEVVKVATYKQWEASNKESGVQYFLFTIEDNGNVIQLFESYESKEVFDLHLQNDHTKNYIEFLKDKIVGGASQNTNLILIEA